MEDRTAEGQTSPAAHDRRREEAASYRVGRDENARGHHHDQNASVGNNTDRTATRRALATRTMSDTEVPLSDGARERRRKEKSRRNADETSPQRGIVDPAVLDMVYSWFVDEQADEILFELAAEGDQRGRALNEGEAMEVINRHLQTAIETMSRDRLVREEAQRNFADAEGGDNNIVASNESLFNVRASDESDNAYLRRLEAQRRTLRMHAPSGASASNAMSVTYAQLQELSARSFEDRVILQRILDDDLRDQGFSNLGDQFIRFTEDHPEGEDVSEVTLRERLRARSARTTSTGTSRTTSRVGQGMLRGRGIYDPSSTDDDRGRRRPQKRGRKDDQQRGRRGEQPRKRPRPPARDEPSDPSSSDGSSDEGNGGGQDVPRRAPPLRRGTTPFDNGRVGRDNRGHPRGRPAAGRFDHLIQHYLTQSYPLPPGVKPKDLVTPKLPTYGGENSVDAMEEWLVAILRHLGVYGMSSDEFDSIRIYFLGTHLTGHASEWFRDTIERRGIDGWTFEGVVQALFERFVRDTSLQDATLAFNEAQYRPSRGVAGWINDLERLASRMVEAPNEYMRRLRFMSGLPHEIRNAVLGQGFTAERSRRRDIEAEAIVQEIAIHNAHNYDQRLNRMFGRPTGSSSNHASTPNTRTTTSGSTRVHEVPRREERRVGQSSRPPDRPRDRPERDNSARRATTAPPREVRSAAPQNSQRPAAGNSGGHNRDHHDLTCYKCGAKGHISPNCPLRDNGGHGRGSGGAGNGGGGGATGAGNSGTRLFALCEEEDVPIDSNVVDDRSDSGAPEPPATDDESLGELVELH
ncbi:uncharacterized protein SCHCODRAFT_01175040 [Schizophyllum commune H4-8]|uniref:uncharacterized protein n=1 Tax=Schizophyllum commune (strain H4-8 / FGSC 9210) TaxID=578458 RepID=UPI002160B752|nr:uncharacterized protein SCHCODRAFT_01175040 [Schizophyllum commune H4-8]KAI5887806.1 hypothetical protein SCHCODRAFT_01175040 [Schizophyllum commune H4-8]